MTGFWNGWEMDWSVTIYCSVVIQAVRHILLGVRRATKIGCSQGVTGGRRHCSQSLGGLYVCKLMLCYDHVKGQEKHEKDLRRRAEWCGVYS